MPQIVQTANGTMIDLDLIKIQAALAENTLSLEIKRNAAQPPDQSKTAVVNNRLVDIRTVLDSLPPESIDDSINQVSIYNKKRNKETTT